MIFNNPVSLDLVNPRRRRSLITETNSRLLRWPSSINSSYIYIMMIEEQEEEKSVIRTKTNRNIFTFEMTYHFRRTWQTQHQSHDRLN